MKAKIVLIRHGMTQGNQEHRYVGTTDEGMLPESVEELRGMQKFWQKQVPLLILFFQDIYSLMILRLQIYVIIK